MDDLQYLFDYMDIEEVSEDKMEEILEEEDETYTLSLERQPPIRVIGELGNIVRKIEKDIEENHNLDLRAFWCYSEQELRFFTGVVEWVNM